MQWGMAAFMQGIGHHPPCLNRLLKHIVLIRLLWPLLCTHCIFLCFSCTFCACIHYLFSEDPFSNDFIVSFAVFFNLIFSFSVDSWLYETNKGSKSYDTVIQAAVVESKTNPLPPQKKIMWFCFSSYRGGNVLFWSETMQPKVFQTFFLCLIASCEL